MSHILFNASLRPTLHSVAAADGRYVSVLRAWCLKQLRPYPSTPLPGRGLAPAARESLNHEGSHAHAWFCVLLSDERNLSVFRDTCASPGWRWMTVVSSPDWHQAGLHICPHSLFGHTCMNESLGMTIAGGDRLNPCAPFKRKPTNSCLKSSPIVLSAFTVWI